MLSSNSQKSNLVSNARQKLAEMKTLDRQITDALLQNLISQTQYKKLINGYQHELANGFTRSDFFEKLHGFKINLAKCMLKCDEQTYENAA